MNNFIIYSLEIAISLTLFYSAYWLLLKNETFFKLNRFYLVASILIALLLPALNIGLTQTNANNSFVTKYLVLPIEQIEQSIIGNKTAASIPIKNKTTVFNTTLNSPNTVPESISSSSPINAENSIGSISSSKINWLSIVLVIYFTGAALFFIRFIANLIWIFTAILKNKSQLLHDRQVIRLKKSHSPFSFLNFIFISVNEYREDELVKIIAHEKVHIQQKHSVDLILFELLLVFQWFNPFVWFYKHAIKITHEYLADEGTLKSGVDLSSYQYSLLNQVLTENNLEIASNYNLSIKKRIAMMTKTRSSKLSALKLVITLPIITFLFSAFALKTSISKIEATNNESAKLVVNKDTTIKRVAVTIEYLKLLEGEYVSTNEPGRVRRIIFTEVLGTLRGLDNGYSYKIIPVGDGKFINPDDHATLEFDTKNKNVINLLLFGKINLKKVEPAKGDFANKSMAFSLFNTVLKEGITVALSKYKTIKDSSNYILTENEMNWAGYDLLQAGKTKESAAIFKLNTELFPNSYNTYDSYGEALMALGEKTLALENYKKSVQLNPGSKSGLKILQEAGINIDDLIKPVKVSKEYLSLVEGDYFSINEPNFSRKIKFVEENGVLNGNDNGYRYKLIPMGDEKFINPDDGASLVFDTKDKNAISLLLFGKIKLKKFTVKVPKETALNMKKDSIKLSTKILVKYCGEYIDERTIPLSLILKDDRIYRHMYNGVEDVRLIPISENMFIYDDETGRVMEFVKSKDGSIVNLTISSTDGDFTYNRKK